MKTVYRILEYTGDDKTVDDILSRSLVGPYHAAQVAIIAAPLQDWQLNEEAYEALARAKNLPAQGWPGQSQLDIDRLRLLRRRLGTLLQEFVSESQKTSSNPAANAYDDCIGRLAATLEDL